MDRLELSWRAEEACMNAWPATRQVVMDGWLLRASGGPIRRTNLVTGRARDIEPSAARRQSQARGVRADGDRTQGLALREVHDGHRPGIRRARRGIDANLGFGTQSLRSSGRGGSPPQFDT